MCLGSCLFRNPFPVTPPTPGRAVLRGSQAHREPPCRRGGWNVASTSSGCEFHRCTPCEGFWEPFITFPSCWAKIMPPLLSSSATRRAGLRGYPVGEANAFILPAAVLVTQDLQNVPSHPPPPPTSSQCSADKVMGNRSSVIAEKRRFSKFYQLHLTQSTFRWESRTYTLRFTFSSDWIKSLFFW